MYVQTPTRVPTTLNSHSLEPCNLQEPRHVVRDVMLARDRLYRCRGLSTFTNVTKALCEPMPFSYNPS